MNARPVSYRNRIRGSAVAPALAIALGTGCANVPPPDYSLYERNMPRSILVLPPLNESVDVGAPYSWLSTVSEPIAEQGYYVFPVAVVDEFMKENGLAEPAEMHAVPLAKIDEIIGADAVLYATLEEFGQKFELLSSTTRVRARARLVDVDTGQELWRGEVEHAEGSSSGGQGALADLITAAVTQIGGTVADKPHEAARTANRRLLRDGTNGLLKGPRHPEFGSGPDV